MDNINVTNFENINIILWAKNWPRNDLSTYMFRHPEISFSLLGHPASFIGPNNEMYCNLLSDQTIFYRTGKSDKADSFQELCMLYILAQNPDKKCRESNWTFFSGILSMESVINYMQLL